jgi:hypothetical protein
VSRINKRSDIIWLLIRLYFLSQAGRGGHDIRSSVLILPAIVPARGCMGVDCLHEKVCAPGSLITVLPDI